MPELTPQQKAQLDKNIKAMLEQGASEDDVMSYATDFRNKYDVKKKEPSPVSGVGSLVGGQAGTSAAPSGKQKITDYIYGLKSTEEKQLAAPTGGITTTLKPKPKKTEEAARGKIDAIMYEDSDRWKDPVKSIIDETKNVEKFEDLDVYNKAAELTRNSLAGSGFDAKVLLADSFLGAERGNLTTQMLQNRVAEYDKVAQPLRELQFFHGDKQTDNPELDYTAKDKVYDALIKAYANKNPHFAEQLSAANIDLNKPNIRLSLDEKTGFVMNEILNDNDFREFVAKENPNLYSVTKNISDNLLLDNKPFGVNVVANEISKARQKEGFNNPIVELDNEQFRKETDLIAESLYRDDPVKMQIYNEEIKPNPDKYIDTPSLLEGFAQGASVVYKGIGNSFTAPFKSVPEQIKKGWEAEASHVTADPKGLSKFLSGTGHVLGLVSALGGITPALGGGGAGFYSGKVAPFLAGTIPFAGDFWQEGVMKYPNSPVKAATSASLNTILYGALSQRIFPAKEVKAAFEKIKPGVANIVENLASGKITREVARREANTILKKGFDLVGGGIKKSAKISAELTGITAASRALDKVLMDDETFNQYHDENELGDTFKTLFLDNLVLGGMTKYSAMRRGNKIVEESLYEAATNPLRYERVINEMEIKDPTISKENMLSNLRMLVDAKKELDQLGIDPISQRRYLFEAAKEKALTEQRKSMPESNLIRKHDEEIKRGQEIKERILAGEEADKIVTESEQKELDEADKVKTEIERLGKQNELDNKEFDIKRAALDGRNPDDRLKIARLEQGIKEKNEDYQKKLAKLQPPKEKEVAADEISQPIELDPNLPEDYKGGEPKVDYAEIQPEKITQPIELDPNLPEGYELPSKGGDDLLLEQVRSKSGQFSAQEELPFFIEQAANDPVQAIEKYGEDVANTLLSKATDEQLLRAAVNMGKFDKNSPGIKIVEAELAKREEAAPPQEPAKTTISDAEALPVSDVSSGVKIENADPNNDFANQTNLMFNIKKNGEVIGNADIEKNKNGNILSNISLSDEHTGKGNGKDAYRRLNEQSISETGNPLHSSKESLRSEDANNVWKSLVKSGEAELLPEGVYRFKPQKNVSSGVDAAKPPEPPAEPPQATPKAEEGGGQRPPGEPVKPKDVTEGEIAQGITHAANEVRRKDRKLAEYQRQPETFEQWNNEAEQKLKDGYDVDKLMDRIEAGHDPTPVENAIRKIYVATLDAEILKNPTDELLARQKRFIEIGDLANSRAGRNLASLKGVGSPLESISDFYVARMEALGSNKLTEQQKRETQQVFEAVQKADANAEKVLQEYAEEIAKLKAENEILRQRKASGKPAKPKTSEDFKKERQSYREELKKAKEKHEQWLKDQNIKKSGGGFTLTTEMAKIIGKIAKSYVDEGIVRLEDVIQKALDEIKDIFPEVDSMDIRDVLAGEYNEARPTRDELAAKWRDLKDEAYYINKLEKLLSGEEPKKEKEKVKRNQRITELQDKIAAFRRGERDANKFYGDEAPIDYKKLEALRKKNEAEAEKTRERIKAGDFAPKKPVPFLEDPELQKKFPQKYKEVLDAIHKREEARHEFDIALLKDQMSKRTFFKKYGIDLTGDIIGTTKALVTGIDASGIGIQNLVAMISHPRSAAIALPRSFTDFVSAQNQQRWLTSVHSSKIYPLAQKAGLDITEPQSLKASEREEIFTHNLLDRAIKYKGKKYVISKYITKPFERIFVGLGNRMRWNLWQRGVAKLQEQGYTWENHPEEYTSLAKVLNTETGRGKLHPQVDKAFNLISAGIWSPRLMASHMNILGIGDLGNLIAGGKKGYYGGLTPKMRTYALGDLAKFVVFGTAFMGLAGMTFADDVDLDPNSSTFGTFLVDGKRYNIWGGFTQYVRLIATYIAGGEKKSDGTFTKTAPADKTLRFLWSKTTPAVGTGISLMRKGQRDYMGQPVTPMGALENLTVPLSIRGIVKGIEQEGGGSVLWTGVPSFVGTNVSYQSDFEDKKTPQTKPERQKPERPKREKME